MDTETQAPAPAPTTAPSTDVTASAPSQNGKSATKTDTKDYTTELPMFDLEEMVGFVRDIHAKGLERAKMPDVAKSFGYETASSTSFYRRLVAARLFGLLSNNSPELTDRARDYLSPTAEDSKDKALLESLQAIPYFGEVLGAHGGKKLNVELLGNDIARKFSLSKNCGKRCAKVFEASVRFAGFLSPENVVLSAPTKSAAPNDKKEDEEDDKSDDTQKHTLYLDRQKRRKFHIVAPLDVTKAELERIKSWLEFTVILEDDLA